jgi:hypothetical protein
MVCDALMGLLVTVDTEDLSPDAHVRILQTWQKAMSGALQTL